MDDIANALKISKRTLYEIFADKETLLTECLLHHKKVSEEAVKKILDSSSNVLEVILNCYQGSIEVYHKVNKAFFEDIQKYPKAYQQMRAEKEKDSERTIDFLKQGVTQGIFRDDINFAILHILIREQMRLLMDTDLCQRYDFLEVYESIIFIYLRGISTEKGAMVLEEFIKEYRKKKKSDQDNDN